MCFFLRENTRMARYLQRERERRRLPSIIIHLSFYVRARAKRPVCHICAVTSANNIFPAVNRHKNSGNVSKNSENDLLKSGINLKNLGNDSKKSGNDSKNLGNDFLIFSNFLHLSTRLLHFKNSIPKIWETFPEFLENDS